jgi:hypothetical protein
MIIGNGSGIQSSNEEGSCCHDGSGRGVGSLGVGQLSGGTFCHFVSAATMVSQVFLRRYARSAYCMQSKLSKASRRSKVQPVGTKVPLRWLDYFPRKNPVD